MLTSVAAVVVDYERVGGIDVSSRLEGAALGRCRGWELLELGVRAGAGAGADVVAVSVPRCSSSSRNPRTGSPAGIGLAAALAAAVAERRHDRVVPAGWRLVGKGERGQHARRRCQTR